MMKMTDMNDGSKFSTGMILCVAMMFFLFLPLLAFFNRAYADPLAEINIRLTGNIVSLGCTVDPADVNKTVDLGNWATKQLRYPYGHSEPVAFSIRLTGCTANGVVASFTGESDKTDHSLLSLNKESTASGVAVEIQDAFNNRLPMQSNAQRISVDDNGNATLRFAARFLPVSEPSAGTANADSEFTLTYD